MAGLLFVTAPEADFKKINHALLCMRDWEESDGSLDVFKLITDKATTQNDNKGTPLPLQSTPQNVWTGADLKDIESYCITLKSSDDAHKAANLFICLDSAGLETKTCILCSLPDAYYDDPGSFCGRYDKVRVPWDDVYMIWCNLDIANMNFEEFVEEEDGDDQGWFRYQSIYEDDDDDRKEALEKKDREVSRWKQQGYI
jgi:hypothetical protein